MANNYIKCFEESVKTYPNDSLAARAFALEFVYMVEHNSKGKKWDNDKRLHTYVNGRYAIYGGWGEWSQSTHRTALETIVVEYETLLGYRFVNGKIEKL